MTTPDYPDFTQGVGILDQAATLTTANQTITANGSQLTVDTSKLASVTVIIQLPQGAAGLRFRLTTQWVDAGFSCVQRTVSYHSANSYSSNPAIMQYQFPARGASLNLILQGDSNAVCNIIVIGSTRVIPDELIAYNQGDDDRMLLNVPSQSIPASSTTSTFYIPPVTRAYSIDFVCGSASVLMTLIAVNKEALGMTGRGFARIYGTTQNVLANNVVLPYTALEVSMTNTSAGALSAGFIVWDVS
jgi:hypothetical protein